MHGVTMSGAPETDPPSRTINVRVPMALYQQLESLAKATARTKSFVTVEALSAYLQTEQWQVQDIQAGRDALYVVSMKSLPTSPRTTPRARLHLLDKRGELDALISATATGCSLKLNA